MSAQPEVLPGGIYLLGWSTGAYLSMIAAEGDPSVKGCILRGVPTSFRQVIPVLQQAVGKDSTFWCRRISRQEDAALADTFDKDILIVVGQNDRRTPVLDGGGYFCRSARWHRKRIVGGTGCRHGGMEAPSPCIPRICPQNNPFCRTVVQEGIRWAMQNGCGDLIVLVWEDCLALFRPERFQFSTRCKYLAPRNAVRRMMGTT